MAALPSQPKRATSRAAAFLGALLLPLVLLVFPLGVFLTAPGTSMEGDYSTFGTDRIVYVLLSGALGTGLGWLAARTARPHSPWAPAAGVAVALVGAGVALDGGLPTELVPFTLSVVLPGAYLLGTALVAGGGRRDGAGG